VLALVQQAGRPAAKAIQHDIAHAPILDGRRIGKEPRMRCGSVHDDPVGRAVEHQFRFVSAQHVVY